MSAVDRTSIETNNEGQATVNVTLGRVTRRVPCTVNAEGTIYARGMTGRYQTSPKAWPAVVVCYANGDEFASFGRDDRSGRFNKMQGLFFQG